MVLVVPLSEASAQPAGWKAYFGNLHSHTSVSDGVERPKQAFQHAKDAGVDFLCLSEHNHDLSGSHTTQAGLTEAETAATAANTNTFAALVGQEFSTIKNGNHVNVYDVATQIPKELLNDYRRLFEEWLPDYQKKNPKRVVVVQFNHPEDFAADYGRVGYKFNRGGKSYNLPNYDGDDAAFRRGADAWVRTIAILSGPADVNQKEEKNLPLGEHRNFDSKRVSIWKKYLDLGLHVGPAADQDNHSRSWGNRTAARTSVWVKGGLSRDAVLSAIKANRTFATEDETLSVWLSVGGQPMGSRLSKPATGKIDVEVIATDPGEPEAKYAIELHKEVVGDGLEPFPLEEANLVKDGEPWKVTVDHEDVVTVAYFVKVTQFSGGTDGRDDVWTSPVWIEAGEGPGAFSGGDDDGADSSGALFIGSRSSDVYHFPECSIAKSIVKNGNAKEFSSRPVDRRLHKGCPQ